MARLHLRRSVIVDEFHIGRVAIGEAENNPPVGSNCYRPKAFPVALERMEIEAGHTHVLNGLRLVELSQDRTHLIEQVWTDPLGSFFSKSRFKPLW